VRIIGVDPGLVNTGVGIIETDASPKIARISGSGEFQFLQTSILKPPTGDLSRRLLFLHQNLLDLIRQWRAEVMAVEDQFYGNNVQTAFKTGQARGAALLAAAQAGIPVELYPPARVKMALVGNGRASKEQVQHMVRQILATNSIPPSLDCSDALAVALCHAFSNSAAARIGAQR
jgi:crossover junction endodeoxyribonuclease RuvC